MKLEGVDPQIPRLIAVGGAKPREFLLADDEVWIGTARENDLVLKDATVSRRHATLVRQGGDYQLTDLGSNNGTFVNGQRISGSVAVRMGDELGFGTSRFSLRDGTLRTRRRPKPPPVVAPERALPAAATSVRESAAAEASGTQPDETARAVEVEAPDRVAASAASVTTAGPESGPKRGTRPPAATPEEDTARHRLNWALVMATAVILGGGLAFLGFIFSRGEPRQMAGVTATPIRPVAGGQVTVSPSGAAATAPPGKSIMPISVASARPSPTVRRKRVEARPRPLTPESAGETAAWLLPLNRFRGVSHLLYVSADPALSVGDREHARYLVYNYRKEIRRGRKLGELAHAENPDNPWYTAQGNAAAAASDVEFAAGPQGFTPPSRAWAFDSWMTVPFHRLRILSPGLRRVGYGEFCDGGICAAVLSAPSETNPAAPGPLTYPIEFPPNRTLVRFRSARDEWPDPLTACPGYSAPSGLPITLELGGLANPRFSGYTLTLNGTAPAAIEACGFDASSYRNADPAADKRARATLRDSGAVVVIPRSPLLPGNYTVSIAAAGRQYSWTFTVSP